MIKCILSERKISKFHSRDIVYEWEDEISSILNLEICTTKLSNGFFARILNNIDKFIFNGKLTSLYYNYLFEQRRGNYLFYEMNPRYFYSYSNSKYAIPIIIDFWDRDKIDKFKKYYSSSKFLLITSTEVIDFLRSEMVDVQLIHFPMALPTKYKLDPNFKPIKKYDLVLAGRINKQLKEYLDIYIKQNPNFEYLYQTKINGQYCYASNLNGIVGYFNSREEYWELLKQAKVAFYATPGIDGGEMRTNNFNPVTPRFFELLAAGCHVIARYPNNSETEFFRIKDICKSIENYEQFKYEFELALNSEPPIKKYSEYLSNHYLENRINIINNLDLS